MSSNLDAAVGIEHVHHIKRGQVTRLTWNGWMVDIDGVSVTVPVQDTAGKAIADLGTLLGAAYRMVDIPIARGIAPLTRIRSHLPDPTVRDLVDVLRAPRRSPKTTGTGIDSISTGASAEPGMTPTCPYRTRC
jgi:hypothetical protein